MRPEVSLLIIHPGGYTKNLVMAHSSGGVFSP
jgi:hypothetical protein